LQACTHRYLVFNYAKLNLIFHIKGIFESHSYYPKLTLWANNILSVHKQLNGIFESQNSCTKLTLWENNILSVHKQTNMSRYVKFVRKITTNSHTKMGGNSINLLHLFFIQRTEINRVCGLFFISIISNRELSWLKFPCLWNCKRLPYHVSFCAWEEIKIACITKNDDFFLAVTEVKVSPHNLTKRLVDLSKNNPTQWFSNSYNNFTQHVGKKCIYFLNLIFQIM